MTTFIQITLAISIIFLGLTGMLHTVEIISIDKRISALEAAR